MFVPVVDKYNNPLMPTKPSRARRWIKSNKATPFWKRGIFCVKLNVNPSNTEKQEICVGIDPGSKKEGFTVKSEHHTYLNIQADAVTWVKKKIETRRNLRRSRRYRKTPCRKNKYNRSRSPFPPSTKARWQWKIRIVNWLKKLFPIGSFVVEDIKARTWKNARKWNVMFSPLEVGKKWFYSELEKLGDLELKQGYETKELREQLGLKKLKQKLSDKFEAHCVDSWVISNWYVGGHNSPDNKEILFVIPLQFNRRNLHVQNYSKGGIRKNYGGTISMGLKRGSLVKHKKHGLCYVGGTSKNRISVHNINNGKRLSQNIKPGDCKFLTYNSWRFR